MMTDASLQHEPAVARDERAATVAALLAVALWSTVATGFKLGLAVLEPVQLLLLGSTFSALLFAGASSLRGAWRIDARGLRQCALLGALNPLCYYLVLFEAYDRLPAQLAQPLNYTWAITLALLAVPVLGQRLTRRALGGIVLSYAGVVILLSRGHWGLPPDTDWIGVALALGSTILWAGYWLLNTRSTAPALTLMTWSFCLALPPLALICWLGPGFPEPGWPALGYAVWVGAVEMGITFLLWQRALRLTAHAARIGQLIFLSPFLSLLLIGGVLGETIEPSSVAGLAVIVGGLLVARRPGL
ncbi:MAG: DMT family transporter [Pseudomonadales bacterium]